MVGVVRKGRRRHKDGKLVRISPVSARNGKPRKVHITHGGESALLRGPLDGRSRLGKLYKAALLELRSHLGGDVTVPQSKLVDQAVRLGLLADLSWADVMQAPEGLVKDGTVNPSVDIFFKTSKHQRDVLGMLGLQRRAKDVTLQDVLDGTAKREAP